jgi:hypothetical protein
LRTLPPFSVTAASALLAFACAIGSAVADETRIPADFLPPMAASDLLLAQAAPAGSQTAPAASQPASVPVDTAAAAVAAPKPAPRYRRGRGSDLTHDELVARRDAGARLQSTGFGLMMGGVGAGVGGLILIIAAANNMETHRDAYGYETTREPPSYITLGVISLVYIFPPLLTTGIIINRIGNHRRVSSERMLDETGGAHLQIGPNSLRLSYSF